MRTDHLEPKPALNGAPELAPGATKDLVPPRTRCHHGLRATTDPVPPRTQGHRWPGATTPCRKGHRFPHPPAQFLPSTSPPCPPLPIQTLSSRSMSAVENREPPAPPGSLQRFPPAPSAGCPCCSRPFPPARAFLTTSHPPPQPCPSCPIHPALESGRDLTCGCRCPPGAAAEPRGAACAAFLAASRCGSRGRNEGTFGHGPTASVLAGARNVQLTFQRGCAREKHPGWDRETAACEGLEQSERSRPCAPAVLGNRLSRKTAGDLFVHLFSSELPLSSAPSGFVTSLRSGLTPGEAWSFPELPKHREKHRREMQEERHRELRGAGGHQNPFVAKKRWGQSRARPGFAQSREGGERIQSSGPANNLVPGNGKVPGSFLPGPRCPLQPLKDSVCPPGPAVLSSMCQGLVPAPAPQKNGIHVAFRES